MLLLAKVFYELSITVRLDQASLPWAGRSCENRGDKGLGGYIGVVMWILEASAVRQTGQIHLKIALYLF